MCERYVVVGGGLLGYLWSHRKAIGAFATSAPEEDKDEDEALGTGSLSNY